MTDREGEPQSKRFEHRVALATALIAVTMAFSSLGGDNTSKDLLLTQVEVSNQWAFYQAKVVREHLYRTQAEQARIALVVNAKNLTPEARASLEETQRRFEAQAERYAKEKTDIEPVARKLEGQRGQLAAKDQSFDYAQVFFQVAIVLGSIAILAESRRILIVCLVCGVVAAILATNGFLLFFPLPF